MKLEAAWTGLPRGWHRTSRVVCPERRSRGRPPRRVRLAIESPEDVLEARRLGAPVFLLTPEVVTALGYPVQFPPQLVVPREAESAIDTSLPRILVASADGARRPALEDVIVALLRIDPLAARGVASRQRVAIDPVRLLRRVVQDELEGEATRVNLQEFAPSIPHVGRPLSPSLLDAQVREAQVLGLRA